MIAIRTEIQGEEIGVETHIKDASLGERIAVICSVLKDFDTIEEKIAACNTAIKFSSNIQTYKKEDGCFIDQNIIEIMENFNG